MERISLLPVSNMRSKARLGLPCDASARTCRASYFAHCEQIRHLRARRRSSAWAGGATTLLATALARDQRRRRASSRALKWEKVADVAFMLRVNHEKPRAVLCFAGGALVGAAPQLTYSRFLADLAQRGFWILTVPYAAGLDYVAVADLLEARFERALSRVEAAGAPVWGFGHSLGALAQVLLASRHPPGNRRGMILLGYTRRGEEVLPVVRTAMKANPLLRQVLRVMDVGAASDLLAQGSAFLERALARVGPSTAPGVNDAAALLQQMLPLLREVAIEQDDFRPSNSRLASIIREGYREQTTLLLRLSDDSFDETPNLTAALAGLPADRRSDLALRVLAGQHLLPLLPDLDEATASLGSLLPMRAPLGTRGGRSTREGWAEAAEHQVALVDAIEAFIAANL